MPSLSSYLDILRQTQADEVKLVPGDPVAVYVGGRLPAQGGAPVSAAAISQLVAELLTPGEIREISPVRPHRRTHTYVGVEYLLEVSRRGNDLVVSLRPAKRSAAAKGPETIGARPAAREPVMSRANDPTRPEPVVSRPSEPTRPEPLGRIPDAVPSPRMHDPTPAPRMHDPTPVPRMHDPTPAPRMREPTPAPTPIASFAGAKRIDELLRVMLARRASDLHLSAQNHPILRVDGEIQYLNDRPILSSDEIHALVREIMNDKAQRDFAELRDADCAYEIPDVARFRVNVFEDRKGVGAVLRQIPITIIPAEQLGLPKACIDLCHLSKGLVVVTGPTGSGKSTTLAAMIDYINKHRTDHIITIEDPVEFIHPNIKCLVNQREVGSHTRSFKNALRAALREDPDIVLVGEMRDLETIAIAIETAETGHLVFGTLHTTTATSTVDRMIDQFPADRQAQIRVMLAESLKGVIAQVLCKKKGGGRVAAQEVLLATTAVSALIREGKTFQLANVMQTAKSQGMVTMNDALFSLVQRDLIEPREAWMKAVDKASLVNMFRAAGLPTDFG